MHDEREVTFLELFYDLVYVVVFAEVAHYLGHHLSWNGLWEFLFMMLFVMWAWVNGMFYHSLHGTNDISMRVFTFMQMLLVGGMTVFVSDIFADGVDGFAVTFGLFTLLFAGLWFRTGYHDPKHRASSTPYSILYIVIAGLFFYSTRLEDSTARWIWGVTIGVALTMPLISYMRKSARKNVIEASRHSLDGIERFGLITIVALGEVIVSAINGVNDLKEFTFRNGLIGALGIGIAVGIWWLYFDFISRRLNKKGFWPNQMYTYLHIPLVMSIAAAGAVLREMIVHNYEPLDDISRWIFVGAVASAVAIVSILVRMVRQDSTAIQSFVGKASKIMFVCAAAIFALGLTNLGYVALLLSVFILMLLPIFYAITTWIRIRTREMRREAKEAANS